MGTRVCFAVTLAFAACMTFGCSDSTPAPPQRIHDKENGFSVIPPDGWSRRGEVTGTLLTYFGPVEGDFTVNFNINTARDRGEAVEDLPAKMKALQVRSHPGYTAVEEGLVTINGRQAAYLSGVFQQGTSRLQKLQYLIRGANRQIYVITFTAPADTFAAHRPTFEATAMSMRTD